MVDAAASTAHPTPSRLGHTTPAFVADLVRPLREVLSALVFLGVAVILAQRTYRAGPLLRRMLVPVLAMAIFRGVALAAYDAARGSSSGRPRASTRSGGSTCSRSGSSH